MRKRNKLVHGVGVNDSSGLTGWSENGKAKRCLIYEAWAGMLRRCYSKFLKKRNESYIDCFVCDDWLIFSNFESWALKQDYHGKDLDKDIIKPGNRIYCPEFCCFVDGIVNRFLARSYKSGKTLPIGVSFHKVTGKYQSSCNNPITNKLDYLGLYDTPGEAHEKWKIHKRKMAYLLAEGQKDQRIASALRSRFL